jgi:hypothetical protein
VCGFHGLRSSWNGDSVAVVRVGDRNAHNSSGGMLTA